MSDPTFILDETGAPIGVYRDNQDPLHPQRVHPVQPTNAKGEPIVDEITGEPVIIDLPLDDPRAVSAFTAQGLTLQGTVLVEAAPAEPTEEA